jgi:excisionase family DNA binding protein
MPDKSLLTTSQAADMLDVSRDTVARWIRLGQLPAVRLPSGRYRVRREDVERLLRQADEAGE